MGKKLGGPLKRIAVTSRRKATYNAKKSLYIGMWGEEPKKRKPPDKTY